MESPYKRLKQSFPESQEAEADFVSLSVEDDGAADEYGYSEANGVPDNSRPDIAAPRAPRAMYRQRSGRTGRNDPRNAKDKPKSKHPLLGYEPWVLVKTKYGRRFVHNVETKESLWRFPPEAMPGVREFDALDKQQKEKEANAKWAEEQLKQMREEQSQQARKDAKKDDGDGRARRRRSESLQREDEAALMAELAAEAERAEEMDAKQVLKTVEPLQPKTVDDVNGGYGSDSSYEVIEVTDSEFEDDDAEAAPAGPQNRESAMNADPENEGPMEFGEDDIAYQLAAMEQDYEDQDEDEAEGSQPDEQYEDDDDEDPATADEDTATFRAMLDDHGISPFMPWEKLLADESENGIIMDDRYTVLPNMRTRKAVWEEWVKDTAARLKEERAKAGAQDPKVPYLAFLAEKASPKLYWPEFKRKYRKEAILNDRKLSDKDREKLYRDHINRLKLPERTRKADLIALLKSIPLKNLNKHSTMESLPQQLLSHLHYISLPTSTRDEIIASHISSLPPAPAATDEEDRALSSEQQAVMAKREDERRKQDEALRARARQVEEEREKARKAERFAKRDLREEETELRRAMEVGKGGLKEHLRG
jgi:hypothetical protein